jgi:hypothetical protein
MKNRFTKLKGGKRKMQKENQNKGRMPDFKGSLDVAAWFNTDSDGKTTLSVVLGSRAKLSQVEEKIVIEDIYS